MQSCLYCVTEVIPFSSLDNSQFNACVTKGTNIDFAAKLSLTDEQQDMLKQIMHKISSFTYSMLIMTTTLIYMKLVSIHG